MKIKKPLILLLLVVFMLSLLAACAEPPVEQPPTTVTDPEPEPEPPAEPKPQPEPEPEPDPDEFIPVGNVNPLTGLDDGISDEALYRRPVAIMVSNSADSLPQWGVTQPDIIYEMLAEGRISRFLAIFHNPEVIDKLASVRSSRPYFIDIAQSYGAVYMHFGGSVPAYEAIAARDDLISIDGIKGSWEGTLFHRDPDRRAEIGFEHSVYTTGEYVEEALPKLKDDLTTTETPSAFQFASNHSASEGEPLSKVQFTYSSRHMPYFTYDEQSGMWLRFQYDEPHLDGLNGEQIAVKNLFILRMAYSDVPGSDLGLVEIDTTGTGDGYYFCDGKYVPITWEKEKYNSEITFYDAAGDEIYVARGQSFISVITKTASIYIDDNEIDIQ